MPKNTKFVILRKSILGSENIDSRCLDGPQMSQTFPPQELSTHAPTIFSRIDRFCLIVMDGKRARQSHRQYFAFVLRPWFKMIPLQQALAWKKTCSISYLYCMRQKAQQGVRECLETSSILCDLFNGFANLELGFGEVWNPQNHWVIIESIASIKHDGVKKSHDPGLPWLLKSIGNPIENSTFTKSFTIVRTHRDLRCCLLHNIQIKKAWIWALWNIPGLCQSVGA